MSLNRFRSQLQSRIDLLNLLISKKEKSMNRSPRGSLIISDRKYPEYYLVNEEDGTRTYISRSNITLMKKLAQKSYDSNVLRVAQEEKAMLEQLLSNYPHVSMEEIYETMTSKRRELVSPVWLPDDEYIKAWQEAPFFNKSLENTDKCFTTNRGELVRSKSEKIIADRLNELNIPYKYEAQLILDDGTILYPDFTILNMKQRTDMYLEQCGMMDNPEYANNMARRIRTYSRNGIVLGQKLWITMETDKCPLDTGVLDEVINCALNKDMRK